MTPNGQMTAGTPRRYGYHSTSLYDPLGWLLFGGALLRVCMSIATGRLPDSWLINADTLYLPALFQDIFIKGYPLAGWRVTHTFIFPDMMLYFLIRAFTTDIYLSFILYASLQSLLFMAGLIVLSNQLFGADRRNHFLLLLAGTLFFMLVATGRSDIFAYSLSALYHFGIMLIMPFALTLLLRALDTRRRDWWLNLLILSGLSALLVISDLFYVIQFLLPAIGGLLGVVWFGQGSHRRVGLIIIGLTGSSLLGWLGRQQFDFYHSLKVYTSQSQLVLAQGRLNFLAWWYSLTVEQPLVLGLWLYFLLVILALVVGLLRRGRKGQSAIPVDRLFLCLFIGLLVPINLAVIAVAGTFENYHATRYLIPILLIPLFWGWPFLLMGLLQHKAIQFSETVLSRLSVSLMLGAIIVLPFQPWSALPKLIGYRPPLVECLDEKAEEFGLKNGISNYWQAKYITLLSQRGLNIIQVQANLTPQHWLNNLAWYDHDIEFILIDPTDPLETIDEKAILRRFGQPAARFQCGRSKGLVYNRPTDIQFQKLAKGRPISLLDGAAEFYPYLLPSGTGRTLGLSRGASDDWHSRPGLLIYGPYLSLPAGEYVFEIYYRGEGEEPLLGYWEVTLTDQGSSRAVTNGKITAKGQQIIAHTFVASKPGLVEIRVDYQGHGMLIIDKIRLQKLPAPNR